MRELLIFSFVTKIEDEKRSHNLTSMELKIEIKWYIVRLHVLLCRKIIKSKKKTFLNVLFDFWKEVRWKQTELYQFDVKLNKSNC